MTTTTVIDTNGSVPMIYYMALADFVALLVATLVAAPFARERDGHLEIALTKPCTRLRYAAGVIGADAACILAASLMTVLALYFCQLLFESPSLDFSGINARAIAMGIACPLAWYAMLCAATTWLHRSYGARARLRMAGDPARRRPHARTADEHGRTLRARRRVDDLAHQPVELHSDAVRQLEFATEAASASFASRLGVQILLFLVYAALAVWQWQRVEA